MNNALFYSKLLSHKGIINPFAALCQCNWETRRSGKPWQSELFLKANNAAGLKKWGGWSGDVYNKVSWEQQKDGTKVDRVSSFCKYPTADDFISNYVLKIKEDYPACKTASDSLWGYFAGLYKGRIGSWATDHTYFERLCGVAIELAPEFLGNTWKSKLQTSLTYSIQKQYLNDKQIKTVRSCLTIIGV